MSPPNLPAPNREETKFLSKGKGVLRKTLCAVVIVATGHTSCSGTAVVPASVTSIDQDSFLLATALTFLPVDPGNANFSSEDGVLFNKTKSSSLLFSAARGNATYVVPTSVVTIGAKAFQFDRSLTSITIPASVITIEDGVFYGATALANVVFLGNAPTVGADAFFDVAAGAKAKVSASRNTTSTDRRTTGCNTTSSRFGSTSRSC